jgi:hypothetical protein
MLANSCAMPQLIEGTIGMLGCPIGTHAILAVIGQRWLGMERAMGIENIAREKQMVLNHHIAIADECCVRFLCEKRCHTGQRQPMRPLVYEDAI